MLASSIVPQISVETREFAPRGAKYNTIVLNNKEWTVADISGEGCFTDIVYFLSGLFGDATITTPGGGTNSRQWAWTPKTFTTDGGRTFTVETGSSVRAEQFVYGLVNALNLKLDRNGVTLGGNFLGQRTTDGATLTAAPTDLALMPMQADKINIYLDSTSGALGTAQLLRAIEASVGWGDKYAPIWAMNRSKTSFAGHIETKPTAEASLTLGADATGMGLLTDMRAGSTKYMRIDIIGPIIEAAITYSLQIDLAVKLLNPAQKGDADGLVTQPWNFRIVHDSAWGSGQSAAIRVVNTLTAL
jgi:hypothetical protein